MERKSVRKVDRNNFLPLPTGWAVVVSRRRSGIVTHRLPGLFILVVSKTASSKMNATYLKWPSGNQRRPNQVLYDKSGLLNGATVLNDLLGDKSASFNCS